MDNSILSIFSIATPSSGGGGSEPSGSSGGNASASANASVATETAVQVVNSVLAAYAQDSNNRSVFRPEAHLGLLFAVYVDDEFIAAFTELSLPSLTVETMDIIEGGQNTFVHKLPVRSTAGNAKLKHGITTGLELLEWYSGVLEGDMENATKTVEIVLMNIARETIITWTFYDAYPISWTGPSLSTTSNAIATEELEFVHHGFEVKAE